MVRILSLIIVSLVVGIFFLQNSQSYDDKTTHPALTDEIVDFYNASFSDKLTAEEKELIVQGAIDEDLPPRWINHFYDPTNGEGWKSEDLGGVSAITLKVFTRLLFNSNTEIVSSKRWARDEALQSRYSNYGGNNTWDNALRQYAKGNKKEAYYILGHILHLLEDATVPDHTRNDTHAHEGSSVSQDGGSPYEDYGKNFNRQNLTTAQDLLKAGKRPVLLSSIEDYFNELAKYSNGYFFSEDTINKKYSHPKIMREDQNYGYGRDRYDSEFVLTRKEETVNTNTGEIIKNYTLKDKNNLVLSSYFSRLTQEAVVNGAGVVKLFHDEAEKIAAGKIQLSAEPQVSWWQAEMRSPLYGVLTAYDDVKYAANQAYTISKETASAAYDTAVVVKDGAKQVVAATGSFFSKVFSVPLSFLSASVSSIPLAQPATQPIVSQAPAPIASSEDINIAAPQTADIAPPTPQINTSVAPSTPLPLPESNILIPDVDRSSNDAENATTTNLWIPDVDRLTATTTVAVATTTPAVTSAPYQGGGYVSGVSPDVQPATPPSENFTLETEAVAFSTDDSIVTSTDDAATSTDSVATSTESIAVSTPSEIIYDDPVVINEIAWMGTEAQANDEWIELYNKTGADIDLGGWTLESRNKSLNIRLTGIIKTNSYFLLERTASTTTDRLEDVIFTGPINNSSPEASLYLKNGSTTIDYIDMGYWPAGGNASANSRRSMERVSPYAIGNYSSNWKTYSENLTAPFAKDAKGNNIFGTPGALNSVSGLYTPTGHITKDTVWEKKANPYFVPSVITVSVGSTLTIEPGVVVKFAKGERSGGGLNVEGVLRAEGTEQKHIIFTSSADDAVDGVDLDREGTSTVPAPADWKNINLLNPTKPSLLKHVEVKYGGQGSNYNPNGWYPDYTGAINIQNSSPKISHSVFSSSTAAAIYIKGDSYPKITQNHIGNTAVPVGYGSYLGGVGVRLADASSTAEIIGNLFENNTVAIASRSASTTSLIVRDNTFRANNKNSEFYSAGWLNLDNSGNRDIDFKGGFHAAFRVTKDKSVLLKADDMPYIFDGGEFITVDEGGALTIEPGTVLKSRAVEHTIRGTLAAQGTPEKPIIFTALGDDSDGYDSNFAATTPQDGAWKNIQFIGASSSDSVLEYVEIRYGGEGTNYNPNGWYPTYTGAINIQNSSPRLANITIENSRTIALNIKGQARPTIKNSIIKNTVTPAYYSGSPNYNYGLYLADASSSAEIIGNRFENNDIAIKSESASASPLALKDNTFSGNNKNGVFNEYGNFNLENSNNQDADHRGGFNISLYAPNGQAKILRADAMPYIVNYLLVDAGGALTIEPGAVLKNANNISYAIRGVLNAQGTPEHPIIFTALADDSDGYDSDLSGASPAEGAWKNIQLIGASSSDSILENVEVRYGGSGKDTCPYAYLSGPCMAYEGAVLIDGSSPAINNMVLDRNLAVALYIKGEASPVISNSTVTNTKEAMATPRTTIGGYGLSIGAESSPVFTGNTYGGNAQDVVYR